MIGAERSESPTTGGPTPGFGSQPKTFVTRTRNGYDRDVSVELARRLLTWGAAPAEVEAALLEVAGRSVSLVKVVAERSPPLLEQMERELGRLDLPSIEMVRASPDIAQELPAGLCERLVAVPVHRDPRTGRVDVAAADAFDPHIQSEFSYHLQAPIRVLRARYAAVQLALTALRGARSSPPRKDAEAKSRPGVTMPPPVAQEFERPTGPPLPLVKKTNGASEALLDDSEPVLSLARPKGPSAATVAPEPRLPRAEVLAADELARVMSALELAVAPEEVLDLCCAGLEPMLAVALTLRGSSYEGRAASSELRESPERIAKVKLPTGSTSVVDLALKQGYYLGALPTTPIHESLREILPPRADHEIYVAPVMVLGRPSVMLVLARLGHTTPSTRRANEIAVAAGNALERILRNRKRG